MFRLDGRNRKVGQDYNSKSINCMRSISISIAHSSSTHPLCLYVLFGSFGRTNRGMSCSRGSTSSSTGSGGGNSTSATAGERGCLMRAFALSSALVMFGVDRIRPQSRKQPRVPVSEISRTAASTCTYNMRTKATACGGRRLDHLSYARKSNANQSANG